MNERMNERMKERMNHHVVHEGEVGGDALPVARAEDARTNLIAGVKNLHTYRTISTNHRMSTTRAHH
jgi:hypothetical protein